MAGEWYRAIKTQAFLGIRRSDLDPLLAAAGAPPAVTAVLDAATGPEPLHVTLRDSGITDPAATPAVVGLEAVGFQIDGELNGIPRATVQLAVGRDAGLLAAGATDARAAAVVHVLERYLDRHVPARLYGWAKTTSSAGVGDAGDNTPWADEWVVLFDGFAAGPTHRGSTTDAAAVLHLTHFTAALTFSSPLSADAAAGSAPPYAFTPAALFSLTAGAGVPFTPAGACAAAIAGGPAAYIDFWGYQVPGGSPGGGARAPGVGVKGFLARLAGSNLFNWQAMRAATGGAFAPGQPNANSPALQALLRVEPFWSGWGGGLVGAIGGAEIARAAWGQIGGVVQAGAGGPGLDRSAFAGGGGYALAGYQYGVPIALTPTAGGVAMGPLAAGRGFAMDIAGATVEDLGPTSFWDLMATRYPARYQVAVAPMADRAVVIPACPVINRVWQNVYASEVFSWDDDMANPVPVRGVVLTSDRGSWSGVFAAGSNPAAPGAMSAFHQFDSAYDSGLPGVFEFAAMPPWLTGGFRAPAAYAPFTGAGAGVRAAAAVPQATGPLALQAAAGVAALAPGGPAALAGVAVLGAAAAPGPLVRTIGNKLAQSLWQQHRLRHRTVYVTGRFRYDIGPGSIVRVELPADKYVRAAVGNNRDTTAVGMVLRVTLVLNEEQETAATALQIGFVRSEAELQPNQPLFADGHPYWQTCCLGVPWCDAVWLRARLGVGASIAD